MNFGGYFGGALAPIATGVIVDSTGSYTLSFLVAGVIAALGGLCYAFLVRRPVHAAFRRPAANALSGRAPGSSVIRAFCRSAVRAPIAGPGGRPLFDALDGARRQLRVRTPVTPPSIASSTPTVERFRGEAR